MIAVNKMIPAQMKMQNKKKMMMIIILIVRLKKWKNVTKRIKLIAIMKVKVALNHLNKKMKDYLILKKKKRMKIQMKMKKKN